MDAALAMPDVGALKPAIALTSPCTWASGDEVVFDFQALESAFKTVIETWMFRPTALFQMSMRAAGASAGPRATIERL
ncbi:hypothetical protein [Rhizobacter sp. Root1221]|uniref:hypothetical protein n=1 Tax=Rhizobacter sp. Root1221 TaxID=1736433 RepID=UPI0006F282DA|nr:hypothetical protein [Rhizobacter sp. Root1221]KQW02286.1 hypothetical protein ASC87_13770 [Rhizobacter sp. Root1221]